jgi:segregation and condensation protein B
VHQAHYVPSFGAFRAPYMGSLLPHCPQRKGNSMPPGGDDERETFEAADDAVCPHGEPDEQVSLQRLTEAFAELLGPVDSMTPDQAEEAADVEATGAPEVEHETLPRVAGVVDDGPAEETSAVECPVTPHMILEAMLFVGDPHNRPVSPRQAAARLRGVSPREVETMVDELNEKYRQNGCPYTIESSGEGYRLVLREQFASVRERFYGRIREARLSQAAIDVLALVAYEQPISRPRVDEIRGKPSGALLSQLVRRQLLRIERTDTKPRITRYFTTPRFLDLFGLENVDDLPRTQDVDQSSNSVS